MSSIVTAVFNATIGLLVKKGRDKAAEKLKDGDVTDQKIRDMIVREIDDIKSKLDGLARSYLLTSISYFRLGVVHLFELLEKTKSHVDGSVTAETAMGTDERSLEVGLRSPLTSAAAVKTVSIAEGLKNLKLTDLDDAEKRALSNAKEGLKVACLKATEAFNNEALSTSDRIQAMVIRVAATILEKVDYPEDAIAACRLCLENLHSMPAVQNSFAVEFKKGFWAWFSQAERREIICTVYRLNRVIYDVTLMVSFVNKWLYDWPCVDYRGGKVDVLRDPRVAETLRKLGMEHLWLPWSFGPEGVRYPLGIATNSQGQFIVANPDLYIVEVFDGSGKFLHIFRLPTVDETKRDTVYHIATDHNDNVYLAFEVPRYVDRVMMYEIQLHTFEKVAGQFHETQLYGTIEKAADIFSLDQGCRSIFKRPEAITVSDYHKLLILRCHGGGKSVVDVYETDGKFVRRFGEGILKNASDITAADGRVMVANCSDASCVHIFNEEGDHLKEFQLEKGSYETLKITFHQESGHVLVASERKVLIYTKDGQFVRSVEHNAGYIRGITVTSGGRIAVACSHHKVLFLQ